MARAAEATDLRRFSVDEYHRMVDAGILREDDRVELIYGVIREMSPKNRPHTVAATRVFRVFEHGLVGRAGVYIEAPLRFVKLDSEPESSYRRTPMWRVMGKSRSTLCLSSKFRIRHSDTI